MFVVWRRCGAQDHNRVAAQDCDRPVAGRAKRRDDATVVRVQCRLASAWDAQVIGAEYAVFSRTTARTRRRNCLVNRPAYDEQRAHKFPLLAHAPLMTRRAGLRALGMQMTCERLHMVGADQRIFCWGHAIELGLGKTARSWPRYPGAPCRAGLRALPACRRKEAIAIVSNRIGSLATTASEQ